ncbi:TlpA family protein disulfide reductase [Guyparkeria hydrothermalis]|uniref:peroxiredoxin family protein n=1 Tax=Guyparkeria hydrothermalis TaxID=923 RepID=UPI0020213BB3|nr:TlpA disulfide reductase family protein [Guyparkeria hydrothermalis]MCL7744814.1 TlpA family protein disulfide reductase [Guyparkeria hydrothermalis]
MTHRIHIDHSRPDGNAPAHDAGRRRLLLGGAGALLSLGLAGCQSKESIALEGVTVQHLDGKPVALDSIKGKPTVITFWATTCPGCVKEIPHIQDLHDKYAERGVNVVGLAMSYDPLDQINAMVKQKDMTYTIWQDKTGRGAEVFGPVRVTPTTFILDREARIAYQKIGLVDMDRVEGLIEGLLESA